MRHPGCMKKKFSHTKRRLYRLDPGFIALVTGSSSGIGLALVKALLSAGGKVYGAARRYSEEENWHADKTGMIRVRLDVTDATRCRTVIDTIIQRESRMDAIFFSAGYGLAGPIEETSPEEAKDQMDTNLIGTSTLLPSVIRQMRHQKSGLIVFIGSVATALPIPFQGYYSASKAALEALALSLRDEVRPLGIRCMVVSPGDTKTGFTMSRIKTKSREDSVYRMRFERSLAKMANDEQQGMPAELVARLILRQAGRKNPPPVYTPGLPYQSVIFLKRILPLRFVRYLIYHVYGR